MKFKLDENIGDRGAELLRSAGHDVVTVRQQNLVGTSDENLFTICSAEKRAFVTLDHDFGHVLRFPPEASSGIAIGLLARHGPEYARRWTSWRGRGTKAGRMQILMRLLGRESSSHKHRTGDPKSICLIPFDPFSEIRWRRRPARWRIDGRAFDDATTGHV